MHHSGLPFKCIHERDILTEEWKISLKLWICFAHNVNMLKRMPKFQFIRYQIDSIETLWLLLTYMLSKVKTSTFLATFLQNSFKGGSLSRIYGMYLASRYQMVFGLCNSYLSNVHLIFFQNFDRKRKVSLKLLISFDDKVIY